MGNLLDYAWALSETANYDDENWARVWRRLETLPLNDQCLIMAKILKSFTDKQLASWLLALVESRAGEPANGDIPF